MLYEVANLGPFSAQFCSYPLESQIQLVSPSFVKFVNLSSSAHDSGNMHINLVFKVTVFIPRI